MTQTSTLSSELPRAEHWQHGYLLFEPQRVPSERLHSLLNHIQEIGGTLFTGLAHTGVVSCALPPEEIPPLDEASDISWFSLEHGDSSQNHVRPAL